MRILKVMAALMWIASVAVATEVHWTDAKQLDAALIQAQEEGKSVLLHFGAAWCGPCQVLKTKVFRNPAVVAELNQMVVIAVDMDRHPEVAKRFGVQAVPFDIYLDSNAQRIKSQASPCDAKQYLTNLRRVRESVAEPARLARRIPMEFEWPEIRQPEIH